MSRTSWLAAALLPLAILPIRTSPAFAQGGSRTHDGLFLRMAAGPSWFGHRLASGADKLDYSGFGADMEVALGAVVRPNLAIHGTLFAWGTKDPALDATVSGVSGSATAKGYGAMSAAGVGVTYFFVPANVYLSGSVGSGSFIFNPDSGPNWETSRGFALELAAGKEWWTGDSWGIGVGAGYIFSSLPDKTLAPDWSSHAFSVRFSATFD